MHYMSRQERKALTARNHKRWERAQGPSTLALIVMGVVVVSVVFFAVGFINWELGN